MGLACPMLPHGQRTIPQGIVSSIFILFLFPRFMVHLTVTALVTTASRSPFLSPCPSKGTVRETFAASLDRGSRRGWVVTNNPNPKYPLEDWRSADGVMLEGWTTTGQDRAWQSASIMQDCKCLGRMVARRWVVSYLDGCPSCTLRTSRTRRERPRDNLPLDPVHTISSKVRSQALALPCSHALTGSGGSSQSQGHRCRS